MYEVTGRLVCRREARLWGGRKADDSAVGMMLEDNHWSAANVDVTESFWMTPACRPEAECPGRRNLVLLSC